MANATAKKTATHPSALDAARAEVIEWKRQATDALPEREGPIDAIVLCAIACTNMILYGLHGTAKSKLARVFTGAIVGEIFDYLFTRYTTPAEINGPTDVQALKQGRQRRITDGKLPQAHVAFLDEGFKANSACLNSMLTAVNEHKFHDDGKVLDIPLRVAVLASNEFPEDGDNLGAFDDRFPFRFDVKPIQNFDNFRKMLRKQLPTVTAKIDVNNLELLKQHAATLDVSDDVDVALWDIRAKLGEKGLYVSDRKCDMAMDLMRAHAALSGATIVSTVHLQILKDVLWLRPEQKELVKNVLEEHVAKWIVDLRSAIEVVDQQEAAMAKAIRGSGNITATGTAIAKVGQKLKELDVNVLTTLEKIPEAAGEVAGIRERINRVLTKGRNAMSALL